MDTGAGHSAVALQQAMFKRTRIFRKVEAWFADYDMIATPTLSRVALSITTISSRAIESTGGSPTRAQGLVSLYAAVQPVG